MIVYKAIYLSLQCLLLACVTWLASSQAAPGLANGRVNLVRPQYDQLTLSESISLGAVQPNQLLKSSSPGNPSDFMCPTQFGHYRDTGNCAAYYICSFGQSLHKNCSIGLYFSERLQTCDWPTNVPCERDYASLAETSVYNFVDETSTPAPFVHKSVTASVQQATPTAFTVSKPDVDHFMVNRPKPLLDDSPLSGYTVEDAAATAAAVTAAPTTNTNTGSGHSVRGRFSEHTSTTPLTPLESSDKVSLIRAEESFKFTSAKYVVDGFEVPANNRNKPAESNLYSDSTSEGRQQQFLAASATTEKQPSSGLKPNDGNSTFREISNLNSNGGSSTDDKKKNTFQKRNDYDPYWSPLSYSNQPRSVNPFLMETRPEQQQQPKSYFRHRPQGELMISNVNPYLQQRTNKKKPESYYVYDSAPENAPVSPYRSRYQHRYKQQTGRQETVVSDLPSTSLTYSQPRVPPPPLNEAPIFVNSVRTPELSEPVKPNIMQPVSYGSPKSIEVPKPIRRKVPEVYIEVISTDNLTAPYSILTDGGDQSLYMVDSRPMKRLNYEINERLLAPFKQRDQGSPVNWLEKPALSEKLPVPHVSGVNRYSNQGMDRGSPYNTAGQYRKKVIRKKKISRPTGMAVSSSTNLYGHTSTQLLTGALVTKPIVNLNRQNSRLPIHSSPKMTPTSVPTYSTEDLAVHNIELNGWKPVTQPIPMLTTPSPLLTYQSDLSNSAYKLTPQEFLPPTSPAPKIARPLSEPPVHLEMAPKSVSFDFKDALKATYDSLSNYKPVVPTMTNVDVKPKKAADTTTLSSNAPYRVNYATPKPKKTNAAQYNRYVVIPQNNQGAITVMFEYQNVTTGSERNRFGLADAINKNQELPRNKFVHDIARIHPTESPVTAAPIGISPLPNSSAPIRDSLEDFIKKTIEPKITTSSSAQPNYTLARSFPSIPVTNYLDTHVITIDDATRVSLPKRLKPVRRGRKYRPLISLNQTTPAASLPITSVPSGPFSSQRLASPTTVSPVPESYQYSNKGSINLNEPNSIFVYHSPKSNEVSETNPKLPFFTTTSGDTRYGGLNAQPVTQSPFLPTLRMTTLRVASEVEYADVHNNLEQTAPVTTTTKTPRITKHRFRSSTETTMVPTTTTASTTTTSTTTTTTPASTVISTDSYGYYEDYDNKDYNDYDNDYRLMANKTSVLSWPSSTTAQTTTTSTTTTTPAPMVLSYRRQNVTSKPLLYLSNRPRPTNRRLVIKDSSANQQVVLASRPKAMYPQPKALTAASKCEKRKCRLPDCRCGGSDIPGDLPNKQIPQLVMLTFDDGVNDLNWELYEELLNSGRKNPNGCPIKATYYVSHEWSDYGQVQTLYSRGHEIASHTISHRFGEKFSKEEWVKEINGQREILNLYGGVKFDDIRGMRAPFLQTGGNNMFEMLYETNFTYDSSLPVQENSPPFWPYTLDYALSHSCNIPPCPTRSFPGLWEVGMVMWSDLRGGRCSMGDACTNPSDDDGVYEMLLKNFNRHYKSNRAPFSLYYHSAWFNTNHHKKGFIKFLDEILQNEDVYMVTTWQALQWVREPTLLSKLSSFEPFQCKKPKPAQECTRPKACNVNSKQGSRTLRTCQECPATYPWIGSTGFSKAKYG